MPEGSTRQIITAKLGISESNDFKLLEILGGECAGALSILPEGQEMSASGSYEPLAHEDLRLSLAGAQQKIPLFYKDGKFFLSHGSFASSHILKPAIPGFEGIVQN